MAIAMMEDGNARESEARSLSVAEYHLLGWLLTRGAEITGVDAERAAAFLPQLRFLRVVGRCPCGCPTIHTDCEQLPLFVDNITDILADVEGCSPEGTFIGIILRAVDGRIKELEAYARDGHVPFSLPEAKQLEDFH
jgi:hypothetical protein